MIDIKENAELNVLNHSCAHMMAQAVKRLYPQAKFWVGPVVSEGFYYDMDLGDEVIKDEDLPKIEKEMKKIAKKVQPDVIHLNSSKAGILGRFLFRNSKTPVFYTPHGYSFLMTNISKKKKFFYKSLEKIFAFKNVETIACSKGEYEITKDLTSNATYVDNGINLKEFDGIKMNHQTNFDHLKIATLGRISLQKNPPSKN